MVVVKYSYLIGISLLGSLVLASPVWAARDQSFPSEDAAIVQVLGVQERSGEAAETLLELLLVSITHRLTLYRRYWIFAVRYSTSRVVHCLCLSQICVGKLRRPSYK